MKTRKTLVIVGGALAIGGVVVGVIVARWQAEKAGARPVAASAAAVAPSPVQSPPPSELGSPTTTPEAPVLADVASATASAPPPLARAQPASVAASQPTRPKKKPELQDPLARVAMSLVGADPDAEAYWLEAIYDTSLPDGEREDLMEDLNEDGLSDHKRPGPQDLPLIINRLAIIEEIAPYADEFMLRHLGEAYKDLVNLADITRGGGKPVQ